MMDRELFEHEVLSIYNFRCKDTARIFVHLTENNYEDKFTVNVNKIWEPLGVTYSGAYRGLKELIDKNIIIKDETEDRTYMFNDDMSTWSLENRKVGKTKSIRQLVMYIGDSIVNNTMRSMNNYCKDTGVTTLTMPDDMYELIRLIKAVTDNFYEGYVNALDDVAKIEAKKSKSKFTIIRNDK